MLISAGNVKRERIQKIKREKGERGEDVDENEIAENLPEQEVMRELLDCLLGQNLSQSISDLLKNIHHLVQKQVVKGKWNWSDAWLGHTENFVPICYLKMLV